jgi:hypothetical protein
MLVRNYFRSAPAAALLVCTACIGPQAAQQEPAAAGNTGAAPAAPAAPAAEAGGKRIIWDGDEVAGSAKGWANCGEDSGPDCKASLEPVPGKGHNDSSGLRFSAEGKGWIGFGWNFFGWWPEDAGIDITPYKHLVFRLKVEAESQELAPEYGAINVMLRCSSKKEGCETKGVAVPDYAKGDLADGKWHEVVVPIDAIGKDSQFDPKTTWELMMSTWAGTAKKFALYLDDIHLDNR